MRFGADSMLFNTMAYGRDRKRFPALILWSRWPSTHSMVAVASGRTEYGFRNILRPATHSPSQCVYLIYLFLNVFAICDDNVYCSSNLMSKQNVSMTKLSDSIENIVSPCVARAIKHTHAHRQGGHLRRRCHR